MEWNEYVTCLNELRHCANVGAVQRTIGKNIKELRNRLGLTQEDIAARTGLGITRISDIERDRYKTPDTATLIKLSDALGSSVDDLLFGPEEDFRVDVNDWPLFEFVRSMMTDLQPYPDAAKWKLVVTAYERAVSRATMLLKAIDEIAKYTNDGEALNDAVAQMLPETYTKRHKESPQTQSDEVDTGNDLPDHSTEVQQSPHLEGDAVDPASAHRIERLERELDAIKAQLSGSKDVARRLVHIAAGEKSRSARKPRAKARKRSR